MLYTFAPIVAVVLLAVAALLYYGRFQPWLEKKRAYIAQFTECGALSPAPSETAWRRFRTVARIILFIQVGKVRFVGLENLQGPGPKLIAPNHGSAADVAITLAFEKPVRALATRGVFTIGNGLGALAFGPIGAIPVDLTPGQGKAALDTAVGVVASGQDLLLFPEGWAWLDGRVRPFKKGAVLIAKAAAERRGAPVHIVPVYMRYGIYPGQWILRFVPPVQYLLQFLLFPLYRRGLTVVFAPPLSSAALPEDKVIATHVLRNAVLAADPAPPAPGD